MSLFQLRWLRRFIRRHTAPIGEGTAELWKRRLSLGYMLVAWNAFGLVCYMIYNGKADWAKAHGLKSEAELKLTPAQQWTRTLGIKDATVFRVSGTQVSKYEVHNDFEEDSGNSNSNNTQTNIDNPAENNLE